MGWVLGITEILFPSLFWLVFPGVFGRQGITGSLINNVLIKSPKVVAYMILGFLSQWMKLLKPEEDKAKMEDLIGKLKEGLNAW